MNQPKVCHLLLGAADEIAGIQKYLCSLFCQKDFVVINHAPKYEKYLAKNKQHFYVYKNFNEFLKIIAKEGPQIIHVHLGQGIIPAWRASFSYPKLKLIYTQHFIAPAHTNNGLFFMKNLLLKFLFKRFTGMIAISQAVAEGIKKRREISHKKIFLIYNGVALPARPPKQKNKILPNIVTVCRLEKEKQPELIIKLAKLIPEFKFTVVGYGALLKKLKRSTPENVTLTGYINNVPAILKKNDFFFFPAKAEPFGLSIIEALGQGLPVIGFASGAVKELISRQEGLILNNNDLNKVKDYIEELCLNNKKYNQTALHCYKKAQNYSLEQMRQKTFVLYRRIINA